MHCYNWQGTLPWHASGRSASQVCCTAGTELQLHEPTVERMRENYSKRGVELNEARLRMATLPAAAEVMHATHLRILMMCLYRCQGDHCAVFRARNASVTEVQHMKVVRAGDEELCRCLPGRLGCHALPPCLFLTTEACSVCAVLVI